MTDWEYGLRSDKTGHKTAAGNWETVYTSHTENSAKYQDAPQDETMLASSSHLSCVLLAVLSTEPIQLAQANALLYNLSEHTAWHADKLFTGLSKVQTGPIGSLSSFTSEALVSRRKAETKPQRCPFYCIVYFGCLGIHGTKLPLLVYITQPFSDKASTKKKVLCNKMGQLEGKTRQVKHTTNTDKPICSHLR